MSENKYTAADFAAAEFAKRPNGGMAARLDPEDTLPWRVVNGRGLWSWFNDYDMAEGGWVPVPSSPAKPAITESEIAKAFGPEYVAWARLCLARIGITVAPDPEPEPTNTGHDSDWWIENANTSDAEDCEACGEAGNQCPVHYGVAAGIDLVVRKLAALGDDPELFARIPDPVPAPGGEDDER